jgi:polyisoprenoid-binding protein YceI
MPRFIVDTSRSTVDVGLRVNLHPSHISAHALKGHIDCELDAQNRPRLDAAYGAELILPVEAIKSGNGLQDLEMRRRFDAGSYPTITARVTKGKALGQDGHYRAVAQLTMHGQTREITAEVELHVDASTMTIDGQQVINVKDFGIDPPRLIVLRMEPDVDVRVHIVAKQQRKQTR